MNAVGRRSLRVLIASLAFLAAPARVEPYIPASDAAILERVPAARAARELEPLRIAVRSNPQDLGSALELAQEYLLLGRQTSDPRFVSYAEATLAPWMQRSNPPAAVLVQQATVLQSSHRFDGALALLDRALALEPQNGQGWLTKATVLQVRGDFDGARAACQRVLRSAGQLIGLTCLVSVDSMTGRLRPSYEALQRTAAAIGDTEDHLQAWIKGQLAEMAVRLGDYSSAEEHFAAALEAEPEDPYLRAARADLLLLQNRNHEVVKLLRGAVAEDGLLLRLAIAAHRAQSVDADRYAMLFEARRRVARSDDNPHLREHARFFLDVVERPRDALPLARQNWRTQKEPADIQLYARAARGAESAEDEQIIQDWIADTGYEDRALLFLTSTGQNAQP